MPVIRELRVSGAPPKTCQEDPEGGKHEYRGYHCRLCGRYIFEGMSDKEIGEYGRSFGPWGA